MHPEAPIGHTHPKGRRNSAMTKVYVVKDFAEKSCENLM